VVKFLGNGVILYIGGYMKKFLVSFFVVLLSVVTVFSSVTYVDDLAREVTFDTPVNRVIVAAPSISDYLVTLKCEGKVIGVTDWDTHIKSEKIGNMVPLNLEKIVSLKPDLVFLTGGFQEPEVKRLENAGIKAFVINPGTFTDIYKSLMTIGTILGQKETAAKTANDFREKYVNISKQATNRTNKPKVLYASVYNTVTEIWTAGTGSVVNDMIAYAGGLNVAAPYTGNNGWLSVGPEFILSTNPDIIIVPSYYGDTAGKELLMKTPGLKDVKAVKNGKIYIVDENIVSQTSPSIIKVLEELNKIFGENK